MSFKQKVSAFLQRTMAGRYGGDQFGRFLSVFSCVLMLFSLFLKNSGLLFILAIASYFFCVFRMFSRNYAKRQKENRWYLDRSYKISSFLRLQKQRFQQRKEFVFFRCPGCKQMIRIPKGKGHVRITCRHCGYSFEKKT